MMIQSAPFTTLKYLLSIVYFQTPLYNADLYLKLENIPPKYTHYEPNMIDKH